MPEKKKTAAKSKPAAKGKPAAKKTTVKAKAAAPTKATAAKRTPAVVHTAVAPTPARPEQPRTSIAVCPRCGTTKFGPEERIRAESNRTVRYTILVCERGHTFARPITRPG